MDSETDRGSRVGTGDRVGATTLPAADKVHHGAHGLGTGAKLGRYVVLSVLGAGGMGVVYVAYDPELDRKIALKLLHHSSGGRRKKEGALRLLREAQATARVKHRNVVTVHDVGQHDGGVFIAMEFVEGKTLGDWLGPGRPWRETLDAFLEAGEGLQAAHAQGLVHRDFKPDNVMVADDGRVLVMDFGLARTEDSVSGSGSQSAESESSSGMVSTSLTKTGAVMGTPAYMAPEQHMGQPLDGRSDQFSFCVALHEALYGERPFAGGSLAELVDNVSAGEIRAVATSADVPGWIRGVLLTGLATIPDERFASMGALLKALRKDPTRKRRGVIAAAVVTAVTVGIGGWVYGVEQRRQGQCRRDANAIYDRWNDTTQGEIRRVFESTGVLAGADAWEHAQPHLQAAADALATTRVELCVGAGAQPSEMDLRRASCLDQREAGLVSLLDNLETADDVVVRRAVVAAAGLRAPSLCADDRFARGYEPIAGDDEGAQAKIEVRQELARADSHRLVGRFDDAEALAQRSLQTARALENPQLEAAARFALAATYLGQRRNEDAEREFEVSYFLSRDHGDDEQAASAAVNLVRTVGYKLARPTDGVRWARHAEVLLRQQGAEETTRWAHLQRALGSVQVRGGNYAEAIDALERALAIYRRELGSHSIKTGQALNTIGIAYASAKDDAAAVEAFRDALRIHEAALGPRHPDVAGVHENLANALVSVGRGEEGLSHMQRALDLKRARHGPKHVAVAAGLHNMAAVLAGQGRVRDALPLAEEAVALRRELLPAGHADIGLSELLVGQALNALEEYERAVPRLEGAIKRVESALGPDHPALASGLAELALALRKQGEEERALQLHQRSVEIMESRLGPNHAAVTQMREDFDAG